jgi:molybdopterin synthase sulfur carrier subunit
MTLFYFAWVRQKIGCGEEQIELPDHVKTVAQLAEHLRMRGGGYNDAFANLKRLRAAVNQEHVAFDAPIAAKDEVAFFPPVTGG